MDPARLDALRGSAQTRSPTVRALAAFSGHIDCATATLAFAAGVDLDRLPAGTSLRDAVWRVAVSLQPR